MFYVDIQGDKIVSVNQVNTSVELIGTQKEISEELAIQITRLPADFEADMSGNIISVMPAPIPEPEPQLPTLEERIEALELAMLEVVLGG